MIRRFLISGYQMASAVSVRAITALLLNKMVAIFSGPAGITLFSHLQNLMAIANQLPHDGINKGFIKLFHDEEEEGKGQLLGQVLVINLIVTLLTLALVFVFFDYFWSKFDKVLSKGLIISFISSTFFIVLYYTFLSYFQALRSFKRYSLISSITAIVVLVSCSATIYYADFEYFLIVFLLSQASGLLIAGLFYITSEKRIKFAEPLIASRTLKNLSEYTLMALSILFFTYLTEFFVRTYAISLFGVEETGYWQAVARISDYYKAVYVSIIGSIFYAEIAANLNDSRYIKRYLLKILLLLLPILAIGFAVLYLFRHNLLVLLYDSTFLPAHHFFSYQLGGDFFGLISFLFIYIIMAQKRTIVFISVQALSTIVYVIMIFFLIPHFELEGILIAHLFRNIFFLCLVVVMSRKLFR